MHLFLKRSFEDPQAPSLCSNLCMHCIWSQ